MEVVKERLKNSWARNLTSRALHVHGPMSKTARWLECFQTGEYMLAGEIPIANEVIIALKEVLDEK